AAGCGISEPKAEAALGEFYRHCLAHLEQETPFAVSSAKFTWTPRRGKVGGHTLFSEMQIEHFDDNVSILSRLLAELNQIGRRQPVQLYLQFFSSPERPPKLTLSPDHLHEMTFQYENLSFPEIQHRIGRLDADANYRGAIADAFLLLEQRKAEIGTSCAATYILRKTRTGGFEVRVTASWGGENIEPDSAIMPLEQKSGFSLARIG
ncbi:MAG TPA: hypothetical protein VI895_10180, partial [Bdellovibrionota bacterium]|nr:hypothetical protein [Bdellovibrionota bacterium]